MGKRAFDILVGTILAVLALPIILVAAVAVTLSLRAFPFFVQTRVGRHGRTFRFVKLRTLPKSFPPYADKYAVNAIGLPLFSKTLRRLHIDELPQLFLVPAGRMSLVGPRPEMPRLHAKLPSTFAAQRTSVRPGCTGLWQVGVDAAGLIGESPLYDQYYLDHRSFGLDLWILGRTAAVLVGRRRVVTLAELTTTLDPVGDVADGPRPSLRLGNIESSRAS